MSEERDTIRLAKRMAMLGFCSRREADDYILKGWVKVNGVTATLKGQPVYPSDVITLDEKGQQAQEDRVTIIINKPIGYVSGQAEDGYTPAVDLIHSRTQWSGDHSGISFHPSHIRGLAPAGRLDLDSNGMLILTQDGRVAKDLVGNIIKIEKEYLVRVKGQLSEKGLQLLNHGLMLDDELLKPAVVTWQNEDQLKFILKQGKKRQIRRMCELVGLKVVGLKRIRIGNIMLGHLPQGEWRYLAKDEYF